MARRYAVSWNPEERESLLRLISVGKGAARKLAHARILLKADEASGQPLPTDEELAATLEVSYDTVTRVRRRFVEEGLEAALERKAAVRPPRERVIDGAAEAKLVALCCGGAPEGRARWTLQLLADKLVELEIVESVSYETVRQTLKKMSSSPGSSSSGAFPPSRAPPSSVTWKTCLKRITCPTIRSTRSVSAGPQDPLGDGQSQHARSGIAVRSLRAGRGAPVVGTVGDSPHAQAWQFTTTDARIKLKRLYPVHGP